MKKRHAPASWPEEIPKSSTSTNCAIHEFRFRDFQILLLPGGFSYGDALGAGARLALDMHVFFHDQLLTFIDSGKLVLGICNGFQTLVKAGVLPGSGRSATGSRSANGSWTDRTVTLTENESGHFECRWVHLRVNPTAKANFLSEIDDLVFCPVAHGEGNFRVADAQTLADLENNDLIAFRYVDPAGRLANGHYPTNPNGSVADIAGICNARGNVVGLMPHPEDHIVPIQNPLGAGNQLGLSLFQTMVRAAG